MVIANIMLLFYTFFKIGLFGFGGGYAMLSMIFTECEKLSITFEQFADLNAIDMVVPGPIAINAATYVGYLNSGFWGALSATIGVSLPSIIIVSLVTMFISRYKNNKIMNGVLIGVKPAAVGLIAAAALMIATEVLIKPEMESATLLSNPLGTISFLMIGIFLVTAVTNIKFKANPILLTVIAGIIGAFLA